MEGNPETNGLALYQLWKWVKFSDPEVEYVENGDPRHVGVPRPPNAQLSASVMGSCGVAPPVNGRPTRA